MGKSTPPPPAPPDYAKANEAAINTDIATLPLRNAINAASQLGTKYTDPTTGKEYDFTGLGTQDVASAQLMQQLRDAPASAQALLALQQQYGTQFADEARKQLQATDPTGFALREQMGQRLGNGDQSIESLIKSLGGGTAPEYESVGNGTDLADTGAAKAGRAMLENQIFDELAKNGAPDPTIQRAAEQAARARGSSRGNILGDSSALQESLGVQQAQMALANERRAAAGNLLASGQTTSDKANSLSDQNFQRVMAAVNQRNQVAQNQFGAQQGLIQQQVAGRQQDLANMQSFLGLQPIVSQGGQLSGLQQGAAPFMPGSGYGAIGINNNAGQQGAEWAGQLYGAQSQQYGAARAANAATGAGIAGAIGTIGGAFLGGPAGAMVGGAIGRAAGCHVAREVYGELNPQWVLFYQWKEYVAPRWFRSLYNRYSRQVAAAIRPFPSIKSAIRLWMDSKIGAV